MSEKENVVNTVNENKKATILQAVKAVAVLVVICLVCCLLLSVFNDLLYISDEDRFNRSMAKIYPDFKPDASFDGKLDDANKTAAFGEVKKVLRSTDGTYIVEALGTGGYNGGSVTLYVVVGADAKIISWAVKENVAQSYINRIPSDAGTRWYVGKEVSNTLDLEMSGATVVLTSTAINNAVNMAALYCRTALKLGKNPEADAKTAVLALLGESFASYELVTAKLLGAGSKVDGDTTVKALLTDGDNAPAYLFVGEGESGRATGYVYGEGESMKVVAFGGGERKLQGLEESDALVGKVSDFDGKLFCTKFGSYNAYGYVSNQANGVYTVSGIQSGTMPTTYVLTVTISTDNGAGKVDGITLTMDGYEPGAPDQGDANKLVTSLVGATLANFNDKYNEKVSGATESANLIAVAVKAALTDFDARLASQK